MIDYRDDNLDRLYDDGTAHLTCQRTVAGGHSELLRQKLSITNSPRNQASVG